VVTVPLATTGAVICGSLRSSQATSTLGIAAGSGTVMRVQRITLSGKGSPLVTPWAKGSGPPTGKSKPAGGVRSGAPASAGAAAVTAARPATPAPARKVRRDGSGRRGSSVMGQRPARR